MSEFIQMSKANPRRRVVAHMHELENI